MVKALILFIVVGIVLLIINPLLFVLFIVFLGVVFFIIEYSDKKELENIQSATVIGRTLVTKSVYKDTGYSYDLNGHFRYYKSLQDVPEYYRVDFEVTYTDGKVKKVSAVEDSAKYEKLMSYVEKKRFTPKPTSKQDTSSSKQQSPDTKVVPIEIKDNQLTQGVYIIGQDIPSGKYDFIWIWGEGKIEKKLNETTFGSNYFSEWIGNNKKYHSNQCIGVICSDGEHLHISGNVVVEIKKSKQVKINL